MRDTAVDVAVRVAAFVAVAAPRWTRGGFGGFLMVITVVPMVLPMILSAGDLFGAFGLLGMVAFLIFLGCAVLSIGVISRQRWQPGPNMVR